MVSEIPYVLLREVSSSNTLHSNDGRGEGKKGGGGVTTAHTPGLCGFNHTTTFYLCFGYFEMWIHRRTAEAVGTDLFSIHAITRTLVCKNRRDRRWNLRGEKKISAK